MVLRYAKIGNERRTAAYSEDDVYRYMLEILWGDDATHRMAVIGLNPSTATHLEDDPTLRRVKAFAKTWGYSGVLMLNAFALRSTDPKALFTQPDPIGPENDIETLGSNVLPLTLAAWGGNIQSRKWAHYYRGHDIARGIPSLQCFRITDKGHPAHPLYLPGDLRPVPFAYSA